MRPMSAIQRQAWELSLANEKALTAISALAGAASPTPGFSLPVEVRYKPSMMPIRKHIAVLSLGHRWLFVICLCPLAPPMACASMGET